MTLKIGVTYCFLLFSMLLEAQGSGKILTNYSGKVMDSQGINTKALDFSAVLQGDNVYFASSREPDIVNLGENNWKKNQKINIYKGKAENIEDIYSLSFSDIKGFAQINSQFTHTGPITFSSTGDTMFFTQVVVSTAFEVEKYTPQIFMLTKSGGKWNKVPLLLPFNTPLFSFGHPSFDSGTNTLYFASDMKGGKGGKDIYYAQIREGVWSAPINLTSINTSANEMYPYFAEDKTLFFASDRELGMGGLDLYFKTAKNQEITNLEFLNSEDDDFGISLFNNEKMGFLSSNRNGSDDIFTFSIKKEMEFQNNFLGKFEFTKLENNLDEPLNVFLLNAKKEVVSETGVNENGEFQFFDLEKDQDYSVMSSADAELQVYDAEGNPSERLIADQYGDYVYELLDMHDISQLNLKQVAEDGTAKIAGRFMYEENQFKEPGRLVVNLIDENGEVAHTVKSDKDGFFDFENIPADKDYIIKLKEGDKDLTLLIFNEDMRIVEELKGDGSGYYLYRKLKILNLTNIKEKGLLHEEEFMFELGSIKGNFNITGKEGYFPDGLNVGVYDKNGNLVKTVQANDKGEFEYNKQVGVEDYIFKIIDAPKFIDMNTVSLIVDSEDGSPPEELTMNADGEFRYKLLKVLSLSGLDAKEGVDEGEFDFFSELYGEVKYDDKAANFPGGLTVNVYNKAEELINTNKTAENGEFTFTEGEVESAAHSFDIIDLPDSLIKSLISIDVKNSEGKLIASSNLNDDGRLMFSKLETSSSALTTKEQVVEDSNLDLMYTISGDYDYGEGDGGLGQSLKVIAYDGNGNKVGEVYTDEDGSFVFERLPGLTTVLFQLESVPENFDMDKFSLFVQDEGGKNLAKLQSSEKGYFVYKPLGYKVDIPIEMEEQMNSSVKDEMFGNAALDVSSEIESVYFGSNRTEPNSTDVLKLEKMLILLEINEKSRLEINAYADSRASDKYNLILSERRAVWIKNYMVKKGIDSSRIIVNAYGEGKLVNDCADGVDCGDNEHALNRRAELRVIN